MKLNGVFGKGSGKVGNSVWAVSGGVQIVRPYNPNVSNPNTDAQVEQRAKLKLMSQLAAALAPALAFKKNGLVSARNQFISANIGFWTYQQEKATIDMSKVTLTGKTTYLPAISGNFDGNNNLTVALAGDASKLVDSVVYVAVESTEDNKINVKAIQAVSVAGTGGTFSVTLQNMPDSTAVYAYGVKFSNAAMRMRYENLTTPGEPSQAFLGTAVIEALRQGEATVTRYTFQEQ